MSASERIYHPEDRHTITIRYELSGDVHMPAGIHPNSPDVRVAFREMHEAWQRFQDAVRITIAERIGAVPQWNAQSQIDPELDFERRAVHERKDG